MCEECGGERVTHILEVPSVAYGIEAVKHEMALVTELI